MPSRVGAALPWLVVSVFLGLGVSTVAGHDVPHRRPQARGSIDPGTAFRFLVLSGAGGHFHALLLSADTKALLAGTHLGLFRSDDRGLTWRLAAARVGGQDVHALASDPRGEILYAATHAQGLLRSLDGGRTWMSHHRGLPSRDLHALALDPREPSRVYVWVEKHGLFRSDDAGGRWRKLTVAASLVEVQSLAIHPRDPRRLYAGTGRGVWLSDDGGRHWRFPHGGLSHRTAGLSLPPWDPDRLFAATLAGAFVGSKDATSWESLVPHPAWWGAVTGFAFRPDRPGIAFAVTHEGIVAALDEARRGWTPLVEYRGLAAER